MNLLIVNGPNLNLVGTREPEVYGIQSLDDYLDSLIDDYDSISIEVFQSNIEGEIIDCLQAAESVDGIIFNAGGYSHTSVAIADCVAAIPVSVIEVHISNIFNREPERHGSLLSKYSKGMIIGLGLDVYRLAVEYYIRSAKSG